MMFIYPIQGNMTATQLKKQLIKVRFDIAKTELDNVKLIIRMDSLSVHKSLVNDPLLKKHNIIIELHQKTSHSKNQLAVLDARIGKLSVYLNMEMRKANITKSEAAMNAAKRYNTTRGPEGYMPTELFHGRFLNKNGETFKVDIDQLRNAIDRFLKSARDSRKRITDRTKSRPAMKFLEYKDGMKYTDPNAMPLKIGDIVIIEGDYNKNDFHQKYIICESKDCETGINWDEELVHTNKINTQSTHSYYWSFNAIKNVASSESQKFRTILSMFENIYTPLEISSLRFFNAGNAVEMQEF
jgi:hypothetical protein